jgi:hypothetical protein
MQDRIFGFYLCLMGDESSFCLMGDESSFCEMTAKSSNFCYVLKGEKTIRDAYFTQSRPSDCAFALAIFHAGGLSSIKLCNFSTIISATATSSMSSSTSILMSA